MGLFDFITGGNKVRNQQAQANTSLQQPAPGQVNPQAVTQQIDPINPIQNSNNGIPTQQTPIQQNISSNGFFGGNTPQQDPSNQGSPIQQESSGASFNNTIPASMVSQDAQLDPGALNNPAIQNATNQNVPISSVENNFIPNVDANIDSSVNSTQTTGGIHSYQQPATPGQIQRDDDSLFGNDNSTNTLVQDPQSEGTNLNQTQATNETTQPFDFSNIQIPDLSNIINTGQSGQTIDTLEKTETVDQSIQPEEVKNDAILNETATPSIITPEPVQQTTQGELNNATEALETPQLEQKSEEPETSNAQETGGIDDTPADDIVVNQDQAPVEQMFQVPVVDTEEFSKDWYVAPEQNEEPKKSKKTKIYGKQIRLKIFNKIGIAGLYSNEAATEKSIKKIISLCYGNNIRPIINHNHELGQKIIDEIVAQNIKATGVFLKPFEAEGIPQADINSNIKTSSNMTSFYYSNVLEQIQFFIRESRVFLVFDDSHPHSNYFVVMLLQLLDLYKSHAKPVMLFGQSWPAKIDAMITSLQLQSELKQYLHFVNSVDEVQVKLQEFEKQYKSSSESTAKIIDRRVQGDERDLFIAP